MIAGWEVRPARRRSAWAWLWGLSLILLMLGGAFAAGVWWSWQQESGLSSSQRELLRQLAAQQQELDELRERYARVASSDQVGQQAGEHSRQTIQLLEQQIFELQQDLAYYKGVLAPASRREGLEIRSVDIVPAEELGRYRYRVMLSRIGADDGEISGTLRLRIVGQRAAKSAVVDLADGNSDGALAFAFRHFQALPGGAEYSDVQLPEGFAPVRIEAVAVVDGQETPVERTFDWPTQE